MERIPGKEFLNQRTEDFIRMENERGVNNCRLEGPQLQGVGGVIDTTVGFFPNIVPGEMIVNTGIQPGKESRTVYSKVARLELPEEAAKIECDNEELREEMEQWAAAEFLPSYALLFGTENRTQAQVVMLFLLQGISPKTAMREIKETVSKLIAKSN